MAVRTVDRFDAGYPLFASKFANNDRIVVCGGGGEGKNGIQNKISILSIDEEDEKPLSIDREVILPENEDNPTSMDIHDGNIYVGVNRKDEVIKEKKNDHLRVFQLRDGKLKKSHVVFDSGSVDEYQKVTAACSTLVAICSSLSPGTMYVLSTRNMKLKFSHTVEAGEINDIQFSLDEKYVVFCTNKKLIVLDAGTGKEVYVIDVPWSDKTFSKLRFVGDSTLIAGLTLAGRKGTLVAKFDVEEGELLESKKVDKIKAPTAMDARAKYIVVAGADLSIAILDVHTLKTLHVMQQVHPFAITSVSLNSREDLLASTSVANTIHVAELPADGEFHRDRATFIWAVSSVILTILIAVAFQLLIKYQIIDSLVVHDKIWNKLDSMKNGSLMSSFQAIKQDIVENVKEATSDDDDNEEQQREDNAKVDDQVDEEEEQQESHQTPAATLL